jgi:hypothetical protein
MKAHISIFLLISILGCACSKETVIASDKKAAEVPTVKENAVELKNDTLRAAKKGVRKWDDTVCEIINGVEKCAVKKIKNSIEDAGDKVEDVIE